MKIGVIARCKNEIEILQSWLDNKSFCDLFLITDNESTDGSFELLDKRNDVIVRKVTGFNEGRDFQILLEMARSQKIDWVFKFDCDEFVDNNFESEILYIINNTDFDCVRLRTIAIHYTSPNGKCIISRGYRNGGVYGVKLSPRIKIRNQKIHVGSFFFYKKSVVLESLVSHYWVRSETEAIERAKLYSRVDNGKIYKVKNKIPTDKLVEIKIAKTDALRRFNDYGAPFLIKSKNGFSLVKPKINTLLLKQILKRFFWTTLYWTKLSKFYLDISGIKK